MTDWLSRQQRSRNMSSIRSKGNATTEKRFMEILRSSKITGWRRHVKLPGKPDFAFRKQKVAVFIDGCFWHGCPRCYRLPEDNRPYWRSKLLSNRRRDRRANRELHKLGWRPLRFWEHSLETASGRSRVGARVRKAISTSSQRPGWRRGGFCLCDQRS